MITASHNQVSDNGIKIADPTGSMLSQDWEPFADAIANAIEPNDLIQLITEFVKKEDIPIGKIQSAKIYLGRDTRPSGEVLLKAAKQGFPYCSLRLNIPLPTGKHYQELHVSRILTGNGVPAGIKKKKTKILEDNWTPVWDEEFLFPLTVPELALLRIEVHEYDKSEKDDFGNDQMG
ncbi:hypothetical protein IFM89_025915 [Coptis chinensis]|uniref:C2 domain-containing protein n=1 Tax=Coptis chinensis TaxID=261450 RepID=A0A835IB55_9MAGN|nr:hypothetical protein IFM89_025915 [Coptis chinensis]